LVIYDELDLPGGKVRMKKGGGHGGHNGIRSLHAHIGDGYRRMRIGIGHPGDKSRVHNWVLGDFAKADSDWLDPLLDAIADNAGYLAQGDDAAFASKLHLTLAGDRKGPAAAEDGPSSNRRDTPQNPRKGTDVPAAPSSNPFAAAFQRAFGKTSKTN
ncbi:MAG: aminoacyl-tRNA hydrolase, partial [Pseudomonadota bacterium]